MSNNFVSGTVSMPVGGVQRLPMDWGNVRELINGVTVNSDGTLNFAVQIATFNITCSGITVSSIQKDYPYQTSAEFAPTNAGTFDAVFTIILDNADATKYVATGQVKVS